MLLGPLAGAVGLVGLLAPGAAAQTPCSTETLKGQYVFTGRGFIEPGDPGVQRAHDGVLSFDDAGGAPGATGPRRSRPMTVSSLSMVRGRSSPGAA